MKDDPPCKVGSSNYSVMVSKPQKAIWHGPGLQRGKVDVYDFYQVQELAQVVTAAWRDRDVRHRQFLRKNIKVYQL